MHPARTQPQKPPLTKLKFIEPMCARLVNELREGKDWLYRFEFTEWTPDGHLRHSKFVGLREDKVAIEVVREG
jgi:hypothetical protein